MLVTTMYTVQFFSSIARPIVDSQHTFDTEQEANDFANSTEAPKHKTYHIFPNVKHSNPKQLMTAMEELMKAHKERTTVILCSAVHPEINGISCERLHAHDGDHQNQVTGYAWTDSCRLG